MNDLDNLAKAFRALGDPTRLRIFEFLRDCCGAVALEEDGAAHPAQGPTVGDVCCKLDVPASTLSHHLKELRYADLITTEKRGRFIVCGINRKTVAALAAYLGESNGADRKACC